MEKDNRTQTKAAMLNSFLLFLVFSIISFGLFLSSVKQYNKTANTTYDQLIYGEFTVKQIRRLDDPDGGGATYTIKVYETDKIIKVTNLFTTADVTQELDNLSDGDKIYCYMVDKSTRYEIAEIRCDDMILSLEKYNEINKKEGMLGMIVMPVVSVISLVISIKGFVAYIKVKRESDEYLDA